MGKFKTVFGVSLKQVDSMSWQVELLDKNRKLIKKKSFNNYRDAKNFQGNVTK